MYFKFFAAAAELPAEQTFSVCVSFQRVFTEVLFHNILLHYICYILYEFYWKNILCMYRRTYNVNSAAEFIANNDESSII